MSFGSPPTPKKAPTPPTSATSSVLTSGLRDVVKGFQSLVSTGNRGLARKATTRKKALISE